MGVALFVVRASVVSDLRVTRRRYALGLYTPVDLTIVVLGPLTPLSRLRLAYPVHALVITLFW